MHSMRCPNPSLLKSMLIADLRLIFGTYGANFQAVSRVLPLTSYSLVVGPESTGDGINKRLLPSLLPHA